MEFGKIIQDGNIERRNLVIMSWGITIFNLADGEVLNNALTLPLVSLKFNNTEALVYISWVMLGWFVLRFWQTHGFLFRRQINNYIKEHHNREYIRNYLNREFKQELAHNSDYYRNPSYDGKKTISMYVRDLNAPAYENTRHNLDRLVTLKGLNSYIFRIKNNLAAYINSDGITSYLMPYIFAIVAVSSTFFKSY